MLNEENTEVEREWACWAGQWGGFDEGKLVPNVHESDNHFLHFKFVQFDLLVIL